MNVAIIGCGNIAGPYAEDLTRYPEINLVGVTDVDAARAESFAEKQGTRAYPNLRAMLADPTVELAINLTTQFAHKDVTTACLEAGKHVWTEKPLSSLPEKAQGADTAEGVAVTGQVECGGLGDHYTHQ
jgi:predicted dehydrogenase